MGVELKVERGRRRVEICSTPVLVFFHGYNAEAITTVTTKGHIPGSLTARGKAVIDKLREAHEFAQSSMAVAQQTQEKYANNHRVAAVSYKVGDKAWLNLKNISTSRPSKKLD